MKELWKNRKGDSIVEATILLPFCTVMIVALYFAAIYVCQKANLQANLQNTLIYYKNIYSDTFMVPADNITYTIKSGDGSGTNSGGGVYSYKPEKYKNPYRFFIMDKPGKEFKTVFLTMCGNMFFETPGGDNIVVKVTPKNYVVYQSLTVDVSQSITPAINLSMIGVKSSIDLEVSGTVVISDGDDFIRNIDFAIDVLENTKIGEKLKGLVKKAGNFYDKIKSTFGIGEKEEKE